MNTYDINWPTYEELDLCKDCKRKIYLGPYFIKFYSKFRKHKVRMCNIKLGKLNEFTIVDKWFYVYEFELIKEYIHYFLKNIGGVDERMNKEEIDELISEEKENEQIKIKEEDDNQEEEPEFWWQKY